MGTRWVKLVSFHVWFLFYLAWFLNTLLVAHFAYFVLCVLSLDQSTCYPGLQWPSQATLNFGSETHNLLSWYCNIINMGRVCLFVWITNTWYKGSSRVEFLLKTGSGYPKDTEVTLFILATPLNLLPCCYNAHRWPLPVSALAHSGDLERDPSHHSHVLEHSDTYGQTQICSKGHQGSSVDRPCQLSFVLIKFWQVRDHSSWSLRQLGYMYKVTTPVVIKLDYNWSCHWV